MRNSYNCLSTDNKDLPIEKYQAQPWCRLNRSNYQSALYNHPVQVDGIAYRSRLDDDEICFGLFDRVELNLKENNLGNLTQNFHLLGKLLAHYGCSIL